MGTSTNGILAYGYDLGDPQDDFDPDDFPWYDEDEGFDESAEKALLAAHGFTETDWRADGYFERKSAAEKTIGVELVAHCSGDYPMYLLAAARQTARRGYVEVVDRTVPDNADERLRWALGVLGITPKAEKPQWLLVSYWG
jgi:hypothetical protein